MDIFVAKVRDMTQEEYLSLVHSLPFGDAERERILSFGSRARALESASALWALAHACERADVKLPLEIARADNGKPYFKSAGAHFSLSHSGKFAVAALSLEGEVGIDVEVIDERKNIFPIAERYFSESECACLESAEDNVTQFFKIWTAKEAIAKLFGEGLSSVIAKGKLGNNTVLPVSTQIIESDATRICISVCAQKVSSPLEMRVHFIN